MDSHSDRPPQETDPAPGQGERVAELYAELHRIARELMSRERSGHTLQATALVHEAFLRLDPARNLTTKDQGELTEAAAVTMRRVLVDHARRSKADKRGGEWSRVTMQGLVHDLATSEELDVLALEDALAEFEKLDPRAAKILELRFFGGLGGDEIADHLDISRSTVVRELSLARAWLKRALGAAADGGQD
ncbi:MAG: ECF-type sigma factor [Planctomycetota bacterium]|jgi:RNA polymerase sigma factor (TIGR02999 family)